MTEPAYEGWAICELMGRRVLAGYVTEQEIAGSSFLRIDIPTPTGPDPRELAAAARLKLSNGEHAWLDPSDLRRASQFNWHVNGQGYVIRSNGASLIYLHRWLLRASKETEVDHRNGCRLDNRRSNLRLATHAENIRNQKNRAGGSSSFRGVTLTRRRAVWMARIKVNYQGIYLGAFSSELEAALAYDAAARLHFGSFARPNFVGSERIEPSALYCLTPTTEDAARTVARGRRPQPVNRWELEPAATSSRDDAEDADAWEDGPY